MPHGFHLVARDLLRNARSLVASVPGRTDSTWSPGPWPKREGGDSLQTFCFYEGIFDQASKNNKIRTHNNKNNIKVNRIRN